MSNEMQAQRSSSNGATSILFSPSSISRLVAFWNERKYAFPEDNPEEIRITFLAGDKIEYWKAPDGFNQFTRRYASNITRLYLEDVRFRDFAELVNLVGKFPRLKYLRVKGCPYYSSCLGRWVESDFQYEGLDVLDRLKHSATP